MRQLFQNDETSMRRDDPAHFENPACALDRRRGMAYACKRIGETQLAEWIGETLSAQGSGDFPGPFAFSGAVPRS